MQWDVWVNQMIYIYIYMDASILCLSYTKLNKRRPQRISEMLFGLFEQTYDNTMIKHKFGKNIIPKFENPLKSISDDAQT